MFPAQFEYYEAGSVDDALSLLAEHGDREVELLAGGHSLLPTMKSGLASPDALIDIGGIDDLRGIERNGDAFSIGALTPYAEVAANDAMTRDATAFAEAAKAIGDIQVRNRGTVGGNIAHSDPASDLPAAVVASDATITVQGDGGTREVAADDFFMGMYETDVGEGEILTGVEVPTLDDGDVGAYVKKPSPSSGYAIVGVAAAVETSGDTVESARVAVNGAVDHAVRLTGVEDALVGESLTESVIEDASSLAADDLDGANLMGDAQASEQFRVKLVDVYSRKALAEVASRL